jgi:hypothetical protein
VVVEGICGNVVWDMINGIWVLVEGVGVVGSFGLSMHIWYCVDVATGRDDDLHEIKKVEFQHLSIISD